MIYVSTNEWREEYVKKKNILCIRNLVKNRDQLDQIYKTQ